MELILESINTAVQGERQRRGGVYISEDETRDLAMRALINHKSLWSYRQDGLLPVSPSQELRAIASALQEMNEFLALPSIVASNAGSKARKYWSPQLLARMSHIEV